MATPKLVRDKIPEIVAAQGKTMNVRSANFSERFHLLDRKLLEEAWELMSAGSRADIAAEIADIIQVLHAYADHLELDWYDEVMVPMSDKADERGEFKAFLIWDGNEPA